MKNKHLILSILLMFLITAGGCFAVNSQSNPSRNMGFPSLTEVPEGFTFVEIKSIDTGDWCEVTYESNNGEFLSLDCYEPGTFDTSFLVNYAKSTEQISVKGKEATVYKNLSGGDERINIIAWEDEDNHALCLLGSNLSLDRALNMAENVKFDREKEIAEPENDEISSTPKQRGTIEEKDLKLYSNVLEVATKPIFDQYRKNDKAVSDFVLESFYKSFDFYVADNLFVEVFDFDYYMDAADGVIIAGGMQRGEDGHIRYFNGSFGQIAAVSRGGQLIKALPLTNLDVKLEPEGANEETLEWMKGKVMESIKSPSYLIN